MSTIKRRNSSKLWSATTVPLLLCYGLIILAAAAVSLSWSMPVDSDWGTAIPKISKVLAAMSMRKFQADVTDCGENPLTKLLNEISRTPMSERQLAFLFADLERKFNGSNRKIYLQYQQYVRCAYNGIDNDYIK